MGPAAVLTKFNTKLNILRLVAAGEYYNSSQ